MNTQIQQLAAPETRIYAFLADLVIGFVTLGIGWLIWSAILWNQGTTPGHKLLHQTIVDEKTLQSLTWNRMAIRELLFKGSIGGILSSLTYGLFYLADALFIFREDRRAIHDHMARTLVIQNDGKSSGRIRF